MKPFGTTHIPLGVDIIFQLMFALVTPALFVGATVGRMKFSYLITFVMRLDPRCLLSAGSYHMVASWIINSTWFTGFCLERLSYGSVGTALMLVQLWKLITSHFKHS